MPRLRQPAKTARAAKELRLHDYETAVALGQGRRDMGLEVNCPKLAASARPDADAHVEVNSLAQWRLWLETNHGRSGSIRLAMWKTPHPTPVSELVDEALCRDWIDSMAKDLDEARPMRRMSPRWQFLVAVNKAGSKAWWGPGRSRALGLAPVQRAPVDAR